MSYGATPTVRNILGSSRGARCSRYLLLPFAVDVVMSCRRCHHANIHTSLGVFEHSCLLDSNGGCPGCDSLRVAQRPGNSPPISQMSSQHTLGWKFRTEASAPSDQGPGRAACRPLIGSCTSIFSEVFSQSVGRVNFATASFNSSSTPSSCSPLIVGLYRRDARCSFGRQPSISEPSCFCPDPTPFSRERCVVERKGHCAEFNPRLSFRLERMNR